MLTLDPDAVDHRLVWCGLAAMDPPRFEDGHHAREGLRMDRRASGLEFSRAAPALLLQNEQRAAREVDAAPAERVEAPLPKAGVDGERVQHATTERDRDRGEEREELRREEVRVDLVGVSLGSQVPLDRVRPLRPELAWKLRKVEHAAKALVDVQMSLRCLVARKRRHVGKMGVEENELDDLTQETIIGAWKNRATYDPERARLSSWLYAIAHHQASTARDRAYSRRTALFDPATGPWLRQAAEDNPEEETVKGEARQHAMRLLSKLAPDLSSVLVARDLLGMLPAELARETGLPVTRIRDRIALARAELGQALRREEAREQHHEAVRTRRRGQGKRS